MSGKCLWYSVACLIESGLQFSLFNTLTVPFKTEWLWIFFIECRCLISFFVYFSFFLYVANWNMDAERGKIKFLEVDVTYSQFPNSIGWFFIGTFPVFIHAWANVIAYKFFPSWHLLVQYQRQKQQKYAQS